MITTETKSAPHHCLHTTLVSAHKLTQLSCRISREIEVRLRSNITRNCLLLTYKTCYIFNVLQVITDYERRKKEIEELSEIVSLTTNRPAVTSSQIQIILFLDPNY